MNSITVGRGVATRLLVSQQTQQITRSYLNIGTTSKSKGKKPKVVILGCGWSSYAFLKRLSSSDYDITLISPRNHFLFTPLLASTSVGTLEFRSIAQPIRSSKDDFDYLQAECTAIDQEAKTVQCISTIHDQVPFSVKYDHLIVGVGARNNTFNIPGVEKYAFFLKELIQARSIRQRIIYCFEMASLPDVTPQERRKLLSFVVCGGGPTGVEFCGELNDLVMEDLSRWFPNVPMNEVKITLLEASNTILSAFDQKLVKAALENFKSSGVDVKTNAPVKEVHDGKVTLSDGSEIPFGLLVWSTGVAPQKLSNALSFEKDKQGRIMVDKYLKINNAKDIYAFGDCSNVDNLALPATAQVAQQQGFYLADQFNNIAKKRQINPFVYHYFGILAYIGRKSSLFQTSNVQASGFAAWIAWRSAYLTRLGSLRSKLQVPFDWARTLVFGRDITNF
ncbi:hypothetical protein SAMD00019534_077100 [Acytostelium subglobosum LB1]|uniref:hypothetical protein n=1 Tax=Acytostelium subglobosum LB1 TaxID=1410327 RepID=UPI000644C041|nr:hypothetical protein SAMD00019534_077100 [Acytostelium subglobosum LB1]GAM24535.1 hypothetical protein SAMD00019534_077100 [Acytostelium subglobosum LB1]|eukprot:XP_012752861.1 hypothetical protein SAMD00019534_077100 [Acytostelium subglobosum LB1]